MWRVVVYMLFVWLFSLYINIIIGKNICQMLD